MSIHNSCTPPSRWGIFFHLRPRTSAAISSALQVERVMDTRGSGFCRRERYSPHLQMRPGQSWSVKFSAQPERTGLIPDRPKPSRTGSASCHPQGEGEWVTGCGFLPCMFIKHLLGSYVSVISLNPSIPRQIASRMPSDSRSMTASMTRASGVAA